MGIDASELANLIGNIGFPVAITLFVLIRLESKITKLTECVKLLAGKTERIIDKLKT